MSKLREAAQAAVEAFEKHGYSPLTVRAIWNLRDALAEPEEDGSLLEAAVLAEREACINIIETYRIPVGNSSAGEMAFKWTYDALYQIRDDIRARGQE